MHLPIKMGSQSGFEATIAQACLALSPPLEDLEEAEDALNQKSRMKNYAAGNLAALRENSGV